MEKARKFLSVKKYFLLALLIPVCSLSQKDSLLSSVPFKEGNIIYEKVFSFDNINDKTKIFNAVKSALIKNTNYKAVKIDEDRTSGNITTEIAFDFIAKPGIMKLVLTATTRLSIDVKENRFRVRLYNNSASFILMGEKIIYEMARTYLAEKEQIQKGKWKQNKSVILPWDEKLTLILNGFALSIKDGLNDDF